MPRAILVVVVGIALRRLGGLRLGYRGDVVEAREVELDFAGVAPRAPLTALEEDDFDAALRDLLDGGGTPDAPKE